jgi:HEAT repeat protein/phage terminase Nu1 subunit (DNA packaging protein)
MSREQRRGGFLASSDGVKKLKEAKRIKKYSYQNIADEAHVTLDQVKRLFNPQWGKGQYKIGEEAIEAIARVLDLHPTDIVDANEWSPPVEHNQQDAAYRFLKEIENNFKYDKLLHIPEQPIILKDQYIPIQVTLERKYTHAVETTWGYAESDAELKRAYALKGLEESQPSQVDWKEAKKQHQRIIVLADPGMGKSTLLRREASLTAQEERQSLKNKTKKLEEVVFPLFLRLSDLAETPEEIIDAIPVLIERDYPETATQVMELLREKLKVGNCLVLLDALDEVPTEHRKRLVEKLNRFAQRKHSCPIICTSRIVGYSGAFVAGVKEVEIVPFSQKQIEQYIETWFRNAAGYLNDDAVSASSLIQELRNKPQIRGLAQNPLLLSLICSLYQEKGLTLPAQRCQVYEQAVRYMLGKWSKKRNPELNDAWIDAKTELLEELAYQFSYDGKEIFTLRELRKTIDEYLRSGNASTDFDNLNAHLLISELSEQDGILQKLHKDSDQQYLFLHRTFQEYLTACYLNRARDRIALAKAHFWKYEWHETLSLLAGLMENPVPLLQAITAEKDDIFSTLLLLAGRCVAECEEISHPLIKQIIDTVYRAWDFYPDFDLIKSTVVALGQANSQMLERLQKVLKDKNIRVREREAWALGEIRNSQAVKPLIQALKDEDSNVRQYAAWALGEIGSPQAVEELISALSDEHINVRGLAIGALGKIGSPEVVTTLISALNQEECSFRWCAAKVLGQIGTLEALRALISALNCEKWTIRACTAEALGDIGNPEAVQALVKALNDENSDVRQKAAEALGAIGSLEAVEALINALNDENAVVRKNVAQALGKIGSSLAVDALLKALTDEDSAVRWNAAQALGKIDSTEVVEVLIEALNARSRDHRWYAVVALGGTGSLQAVEVLIKALNDEDSLVKEMATGALGQIGSLQAVEALISALKDKDSRLRGGAARALGKIGTLQAVEALIKVLDDKDINARWSAALALGKIGSPEAVEALIKALNDEDINVTNSNFRNSVAFSLGEIGSSDVIEALIKALNDKVSQVRSTSARALGKIGTLETLEKVVQLPEIDICNPDIFLLARTLAIRFSKERVPFIPVYPELVAHKQ